ncbi:uncharacterized protein LOC143196945 [Rhynchophorus ferrugineus]|uniref:uncharacterized protein LOC143196945 n=1 Tax=Rhynchophorus ferrugineus TaxID=354439 RepID=UPI003FCEA414
MRRQIFILLLSAFLAADFVAAVVNIGKTKVSEESGNDNRNDDDSGKNEATGDLASEGSESTNRREASISSYLPPISGSSLNLPVPVYGVPDAPSNNVVYPPPPPDVPPPLPSSLYGTPSLGKVYGVPQVNSFSKFNSISSSYGAPSIKYGPPHGFNKFSSHPKPVYGPPKVAYGPPSKPLKYYKFPPKTLGLKPPKPIYGAPFNTKNTFNYNKFTNFNNNNNNNKYQGLFTQIHTSSNSLSNLYNGLSSLNYQYGAPILPPKETISLQYGSPQINVLTSYGVPEQGIVESSAIGYGPPQPSPNPKPPHPGAPAPPTPPDIKYDGWHPIPGLVSKRPVEEIGIGTHGTGYQNLSPPPLSGNYGPPQVTVSLDVSHENNGLADSYSVPLNSVTGTGSKGVTDSYSAPLGSVTGSGGIVSASFDSNQGSSSSSSSSLSSSSSSLSTSHGGSHSLNIDLSSLGINQATDIQGVQSIGYEIFPQGSSGGNGGASIELIDTYGPPISGALTSSVSHAAGQQSLNSLQSSFQSYNQGHKETHSGGNAIGLTPPGGVYGAPPSGQYGAPLQSNNHGSYKGSRRPIFHKEPIPHGVFQNIAKDSFHKDLKTFGSSASSSYLPPTPPALPSTSYGVPSGSGAISYQNVAHGSSTAGIEQHSLHIDGANSLPLTSYHTPLSSVDGSYSIASSSSLSSASSSSSSSSSTGVSSVGLDYSQPAISIDLTQGKQIGGTHDCSLNKQLPVPSLAYGVPAADSYTSSLSSLTTNIATSQSQTLVPQPTYGVPQSAVIVPSLEYGSVDLDHSSSIKTEVKANSVSGSDETHGKSYGKSVAESFGPNSELVESQSIDLNNIPLQGNLGSYTLQIQSADGTGTSIPYNQVLNEGLLQSILQAIEQPGQKGDNKYPVIIEPRIPSSSYLLNQTLVDSDKDETQASEIREVIVEAPKDNKVEDKADTPEDEETLQLLDTSNIALYFKKEDDSKKSDTVTEEKSSNDDADDDDDDKIATR